MARPRKSNPAYRHHRASGQAVVTLSDPRTGRRKDFYLGAYDTPESHKRYAELLEAFRRDGETLDGDVDPLPPQSAEETVTALLLAYWKHESKRLGNGESSRPTGHLYALKSAIRICRRTAGRLAIRRFGPKALQQVRDAMVDEGWRLSTINRSVSFIVAAFRWGVSQERVPVEVLTRLETVRTLRRGEVDVPESEKVQPVDLKLVEAVRPWVSPQVRAMIDLQRYTGARAGEIVQMRPRDLDMDRKIWVYTPDRHKTAHRGHRRVILLGPKAHAVLEPFLENRPADAFVFSPAEAEAARHAAMRAQRTSHPSVNKTRDAERADRKGAGAVAPGDHYTTDTYRRAIQRACDRAFPPPKPLKGDELKQWRKQHRWSPHQLRHTAATEIRRTHGLEAASLLLVHSSATITDAVYAERDLSKIEAVVLETG